MSGPRSNPSCALSLRGTRAGFTLIEIMVALAILGLMAAMVSVNMGGVTQGERLRAAARKLAGMSDFIRSQAAGTKRTCYLEIDFDRSRFRFRQDPPQDPYGQFIDPEEEGRCLSRDEIVAWNDSFEWDALPIGVHFRNLWYDPKLSYTKGTATVIYKPNGTLNTYILWIQAAKEDENEGGWYSVYVNGLTGKSEAHDYKMAFPDATDADFDDVMGNDLPGGKGK